MRMGKDPVVATQDMAVGPSALGIITCIEDVEAIISLDFG
jgi:hypothetical protein